MPGKDGNMRSTCRFGLEILFDGYLTGMPFLIKNNCKSWDFLFDGYLMKERFTPIEVL